MHELAVKLNETLKGTCAYDLLSDYGLRMYVPKGIIVQSAEAKQKATKYNATIGVALENGTAMYIPAMKAQFADTMKVGEIFPYAPMGGVPALRKIWKEDMYAKNPLLAGKSISLPVVTSGLTNSLSLVCSYREAGSLQHSPGLSCSRLCCRKRSLASSRSYVRRYR